MNALKKSGDSQDQILQEVSSGQTDYSSEFNKGEDEEMNATACPTDETFQFRCENGGLCLHDGMIPFCQFVGSFLIQITVFQLYKWIYRKSMPVLLE